MPYVLGCWITNMPSFHRSQGEAGKYILPDYQLGGIQVSWVQTSTISKGTDGFSANPRKEAQEGLGGVREGPSRCCEEDSFC